MTTKADLKKKHIAELAELQRAYNKVLTGESGKLVLADLEKSCFRDRAIYQGDQIQAWINEGKRQVLNHMLKMRDLDLDHLRLLYEARTHKKGE